MSSGPQHVTRAAKRVEQAIAELVQQANVFVAGETNNYRLTELLGAAREYSKALNALSRVRL